MAYNTGNAIGSTDARDLYDNAQNLDKAMNSTDPTWTDRLGVARPTFKGVESELNQKVAAAAASADEAAAMADSIDDRYLGAKASDPTTDNDGNPLQIGAEYYNTTTGYKRTYGNTGWYTPNVDGQALGQTGTGQGAEMVGSDDGASGSKWTTVKGFIVYLMSSLGAAIIGFTLGVVGAVMRTLQDKNRETKTFDDFIPEGTDTTTADCTAWIRSAVAWALQNECNIEGVSGKTYRITGEIDFPKFHSGVLRRWITFSGNGCTILIDGSNITAFGYTKQGTGAFDNANYFLIFEDFNFKSTSGNGCVAIRPAGFVSCKYKNLHFWAVDYPFFQQTSDPRNTPNYVQSAHIENGYSIQHKRFFTATQVYDFRMRRNIVDAGVDGIRIDKGASGQSGYVCDISGNVFQSHSGRAMILGGMQGLTLHKNYFENNAYEVLLASTITQRDGEDGVYWEYIAGTTAWASGASIADSGTYRANAGNLYVSSTIGITGATAPTHTTGTVSDGGVSWTFIGSYTDWSAGESIANAGVFRSNASKVYRSATAGTTGATAPTHTTGTVYNYGGSIKNNFNQPKGTPVAGYRAFIELGETPSSGFELGGNVDQAQRAYYFSQYAQGFFNTIGDRTAVKTADLYSPTTRPDSIRAIFADSYRWGILWGKDGGMILNPISRGIEYTHSEYDYLDPVTNARVPIVQGVANIAAPGSGAGVEGKAWPPSTYPTIYPQKPWARGSYLVNPTPEVLGSAGSQYVIKGWICTVAGTPGTWVACRTLTGT